MSCGSLVGKSNLVKIYFEEFVYISIRDPPWHIKPYECKLIVHLDLAQHAVSCHAYQEAKHTETHKGREGGSIVNGSVLAAQQVPCIVPLARSPCPLPRDALLQQSGRRP